MVDCILSNVSDFGNRSASGREEAGTALQLPLDIMWVENSSYINNSSLKVRSPLDEISSEKNVSDIVVGYEDPHVGWESRQVKDLLRSETEKWVFGLADWKSFISLTFKEEKTPDVAAALFKWFIRQNNEHAFGKHYTRTVGHSYFSYVVGMEYQTRDVVHFHALVDKPIDFSFVHKTWGDRCGFAWIDGNIRSKAAAVNYVCKYTVKGGQIDAYVAKKQVFPAVLPPWWHDGALISSRIAQGAPFALGDLLKVLDDEGKLIIS